MNAERQRVVFERRKLEERLSKETLRVIEKARQDQEALLRLEGTKFVVMYDDGMSGRSKEAQICKNASEAEAYIRIHSGKYDGRCNWRYVIRRKK